MIKVASQILIIAVLSFFVSCTAKRYIPPLPDPTSEEHPRILWFENEEEQIKDLIANDATLRKVHDVIIEESNKILVEPELKRDMIGRRLLSTSRELRRRIFFLAYSYRMTLQKKYLWKARDELLAVSDFYDWNPSHFLDVAEMTMGVALGYDWLHHELSNNTRYLIKKAIINKGLTPSDEIKYNWFLGSTMNWNQVCNAGMVFGALAIEQEYPNLADDIIDRSLESIPIAMDVYDPDGVYPEGYIYWKYGTTFNVLLLSALEKLGGYDHALSSKEGFLRSAHFMKHMVGPTLKSFNWSDCKTQTDILSAMFWFAGKTDDPSLLWNEKMILENDGITNLGSIAELPILLIWAQEASLSQVSAPKDNFWVGGGPNPVAMMRSSWTDEDAIYLGFKAGMPSYVHGHMDVGSFVMDALGVRWAADLGHQNYESLESKGLSLWNTKQNSDRWKVFRLSTFAHNVLIVDEYQQRVDGYAEIEKYSDDPDFMYAVSDLSSIYDKLLLNSKRGVGIKDGKYTIVRDEFETLRNLTTLRWNMMTFADIELGDNEAILTYDGKKLYLKVQGPVGIQMKTWSTAPINDYDAENPGTVLVGFEADVPAYTKDFFEVLLIPEPFISDAAFINLSLDEW